MLSKIINTSRTTKVALVNAYNSEIDIKEAFEKGHKLVKSKSRELVQMFEKSAVFSDAANEIIGLFEAMLPKV